MGQKQQKVLKIGSVAYLEMAVEVGQQNRDESVESVEVQLQHWELCVEQRCQIEAIDDLADDSK